MNLTTEHLTISDITIDHASFMFDLMNTSKWKEFIGDRNILSFADASNYIQKIIDTKNTNYWVIETLRV